MARLIDVDALKKDLSENYTFYGIGQLMNDFYEALDSAPSIDIVRCKECKNREKYPCGDIEFYECSHLRLYGTKVGVEDDWFCADGERKENE